MSGDRRPAVFLDRDGVINEVVMRNGVSHPPDDWESLRLCAGVAAALKRIAALDLPIFVVTNQPDVARGAQRLEEVERIHSQLRDVLPLDDIFVCYHDTPDGCTCRKPAPGMLTEAAEKWSLDLSRSFLVGDRWSDIAAGGAVGCRTLLIDRSYSGRSHCTPDTIVEDLPQAVDWILQNHRQRLTTCNYS